MTKIPTVSFVITDRKRHAADVEGKIPGCPVLEAVKAPRGKNKVTPILYTDIGDHATAANVDKAKAIGKKPD